MPTQVVATAQLGEGQLTMIVVRSTVQRDIVEVLEGRAALAGVVVHNERAFGPWAAWTAWDARAGLPKHVEEGNKS